MSLLPFSSQLVADVGISLGDEGKGRLIPEIANELRGTPAAVPVVLKVNGGGQYIARSFPPERKRIDVGDYYSDFRLIGSTLGWKPRVPLEEGLARTLAFYREHLKHYL